VVRTTDLLDAWVRFPSKHHSLCSSVGRALHF